MEINELIKHFNETMIKKQKNCEWNCIDCGKNTFRSNIDYYMIHDHIWISIFGNDKGMLCIKCLEGRLKRLLTISDFIDAPINDENVFVQSLKSK